MAASLTVSDLLDGHVALDLECLDRVYLNGYVPNLQVGGQVVSFMTAHLGYPIPSPAIMEKIGTAFRRSVRLYLEDNHIPVVRFHKGDRKIEVMGRYLAAQAATGRSGVAAIGVAQEYQNVFAATERDRSSGVPWFSFTKADRRVTCFYFYLWDVDFGPAFIKVCAYFPYPIKVWVNGHEWAKRQATAAGIEWTALSNGFATCDDPAGLQAICDRLGPKTIQARRLRASNNVDSTVGSWAGSLLSSRTARTMSATKPAGTFPSTSADRVTVIRTDHCLLSLVMESSPTHRRQDRQLVSSRSGPAQVISGVGQAPTHEAPDSTIGPMTCSGLQRRV